MPLALPDCQAKTIVDWNLEIGEDGIERQRPIMKRGVIVKTEGSHLNHAVGKIWVCFGKSPKWAEKLEHKKFKVNGVEVECVSVPGAELNRVHSFDTKEANLAWRRLFQIPFQIGQEVRRRERVTPRIEDDLALSGTPKDGVVEDGGAASLDGMDLPTEPA